MEINTKEEYLAWRDEWRIRYQQLSLEIRNDKIEIKEGARAHRDVGTLQWQLIGKRKTATAMLEDRKYSKLRAQEISNN